MLFDIKNLMKNFFPQCESYEQEGFQGLKLLRKCQMEIHNP